MLEAFRNKFLKKNESIASTTSTSSSDKTTSARLEEKSRHPATLKAEDIVKFEEYKKAAEQGHTNAQFRLGHCYEYGIGVAKNNEEAVSWYRKAAEQGNAFAQHYLGICYEEGVGVAKDEKEAASWYRKAAEQGDAVVQRNLGRCYEYGIGVAKNNEEAASWYRKAAEQGNAVAQRNLGRCYEKGVGVAKDDKEAVSWYRKAAEQGDAHAQGRLGFCHLKGIGVVKDNKEAAIWYRKVAEKGNAIAQRNLGRCYEYGIGVAKNNEEAVSWYTKAAEKRNGDAQRALERILAQGNPEKTPVTPTQPIAASTTPENVSDSKTTSPPLEVTFRPLRTPNKEKYPTPETVVEKIDAQIKHGDVVALKTTLEESLRQQPEVTQKHLQDVAVHKVLESKASNKINLVEALIAEGASVIQPDAEGITPVEKAFQQQASPELLQVLQTAEQQELDHRDEAALAAFEQEIKNPAPTRENKLEKPAESIAQQVARRWREVREKLPGLRAQTAALSQAAPSDAQLTREQKLEKIVLFKKFLEVELTERYVKSLAIHYKLVDAHNQGRVGTVVNTLGAAASLIPIPGAGLAFHLLFGAGKYVASKIADKITEKRELKKAHGRLQEMTTLEEAAAQTRALTHALTYRYQLAIAQMQPASLEIFARVLVNRLVSYSDLASKNGFSLDGKLIDITRDKATPSLMGPKLPLDKRQANKTANLVMGTSLYDAGESKPSGPVARFTDGVKEIPDAPVDSSRVIRLKTSLQQFGTKVSTTVGNTMAHVVGDRVVKFETPSGSKPKTAMVQEVCRRQPITLGKDATPEKPTCIYCTVLPDEKREPSKELAGLEPMVITPKEANFRCPMTDDDAEPTPYSGELLIFPEAGQSQKSREELEAENAALHAQLAEAQQSFLEERDLRMTAEKQLGMLKQMLPSRLETGNPVSSQQPGVLESKTASTQTTTSVSERPLSNISGNGYSPGFSFNGTTPVGTPTVQNKNNGDAERGQEILGSVQPAGNIG